MDLRVKLLAVVAAASTAVAWHTVFAQPYPVKPIRLLVPYSPGGTTDLMARALQEPFLRALGQPMVVENKAGGAGTIAMRDAARAAPDGYTLVFINNGLIATAPVLVKDAGYDGARDFAPVGFVASAPMFVVANPAVPANDLRDFIDYARKNPGAVEYATAGSGSFGHLSSELFARLAGLRMVHVPYKGQAATVTAVMAGEVKLLITSPSSTMKSLIDSGKLRLLGVGSDEPTPLAPGAPTVGSVLTGYQAESWFAILAPAATPPAVVDRINDVLRGALGTAEMRDRFAGFGLVARTGTPQALRAAIVDEVKLWGDVIRDIGLKSE